jgi:trehalose 6-phosphate phosphatase
MNEQFESCTPDIEDCAFFLDLDGTLADIQPRPERVFIPADTLATLERLHACGISVSVISGRPLEQIDQLLGALRLPAAGVHGAQRRGADGVVHQLTLDNQLFDQIQRELSEACATHPGLYLENKSVAFALHFRQAPELEPVAQALAEGFVARYPEALALQPGKCVFELKPRGASKGEVIRCFMSEAPFKGKYPVFIGDDVTDEAGFAVVNALGGLSIKVGHGPSEARQRLESVAAVGRWLASLKTSDTGNQPSGQSEMQP